MENTLVRNIATTLATIITTSVLATSACAVDDTDFRAADLDIDGPRVLMTLPVTAPVQLTGGGAHLLLPNTSEPLELVLVDPATLPLDAYDDIAYELHALSGVLTDEQYAVLETEPGFLAAHLVEIVTDAGAQIETDPMGTALLRFALVEPLEPGQQPPELKGTGWSAVIPWTAIPVDVIEK